jgi:hypothetical protein
VLVCERDAHKARAQRQRHRCPGTHCTQLACLT